MVYKIEGNIDSDIIDGEDDNDVERLYPNVKLIKRSKELTGACFNYALCDKLIDSCDWAYDILKAQYQQISIEQAKKGDIISYHELSKFREFPHSWNALHFAIIEKTNGTIDGTIIKSKWGNMGVFKSSVTDVFDFYGNAIVIWKKK